MNHRAQMERIGRECVRELTKPREGGTVTTMCTMPRNGFPRGRKIGMHKNFPIRIYDADTLLKAVQSFMARSCPYCGSVEDADIHWCERGQKELEAERLKQGRAA